jgi:hypothetical protein
MRKRIYLLAFAALAASAAVPATSLGQAGPPPADPASSVPPGIEVQARGPVHEAFAQPVSTQPEPSPVVPQAPPEPVPEEPPDQRPEGDNVQWIGGYWAWDADRNEFIWVSGTYRNVPPGQRWVPGYWENTPDGWRWVGGFWAPDTQAETPYLPQPPAPLNTDPSTPPPDDNSFYTPGVWVYRQTRYVWRPGFWRAYRPGLVWVPACYTWTPSGCVFVDGYWDYPLEDRGLLFAPVCFTRPLWQTPGWFYQPSYVVGCGPLLNAFFVRPGWGSYYFGDYYGAGYAGRGFQPWFAYGPRFRDPLYGYYGWSHRGNPGWQAGLRQLYLDRVAGRAPLPPRTLVQQNTLLRQSIVNNNTTIVRNNSLRMVSTLNQFRGSNVRLTRVSATQRTTLRVNAQQMRTFGLARSRSEAALRAPRAGLVSGRPAGALKLPVTAGKARATVSPHVPQAGRPAFGPTARDFVHPQGDPKGLGRPQTTPGHGAKAVAHTRPTSPTVPGPRPSQPHPSATTARAGSAPAWTRNSPPQTARALEAPHGQPYRSVGGPGRPSAVTTRTPGIPPGAPRSNLTTPRTVGASPQPARQPAAQPRLASPPRSTPQAGPQRTARAVQQPAARQTRPAASPPRATARPPAAQPRNFTAAARTSAAARPAARAPAAPSRPVQATRAQATRAQAPAAARRPAPNNSHDHARR